MTLRTNRPSGFCPQLHDTWDPTYRELGLFEHLHCRFAREEPKVCAIEMPCEV